jgi:hypothetical protein
VVKLDKKRARKRKEWEPKFHDGAQKWRVVVPIKFSSTGKRQDKYFDSQKDAEAEKLVPGWKQMGPQERLAKLRELNRGNGGQ